MGIKSSGARRRACTTAVATLALFAGSTASAGAESPARGATIQGIVIAVDATRLELILSSGITTVPLSSGTRVFRRCSGSMVDVRPGQTVDVQVSNGAVNAVVVNPNAVTSSPPHRIHWHHRRLPAAPGAPASHLPPGQIEGQVVAVSGNSITIRGSRHHLTTYGITGGVRVTATRSGSAADLAVGETVRVMRDSAGAALAVIILSA